MNENPLEINWDDNQIIQFDNGPSWVEFTCDEIRFTNERRNLYVRYEGDYMNPMPEIITFILKGVEYKYVKT